MYEKTTFDRKELADLLKVSPKVKDNPIWVREAVDKKLARLFGARYFMGHDWRIFSKHKYSLDQLAQILKNNGVDVPAQDFVKERLIVDLDGDRYIDNYYFFKETMDTNGKKLYELNYYYGSIGRPDL